VSHIDGSSDENDIANKFAEYFSSFDLEFNSVIDNGIDTLNEQCDDPGNPVKCDECYLTKRKLILRSEIISNWPKLQVLITLLLNI